MTLGEFAKEFKTLKDDLSTNYFTAGGEISRLEKLQSAGLSSVQVDLVREIFEAGLTDALYTVLLGLDGCASIGSEQNDYSVRDEEGNLVAGEGKVESYAWEEFHGS